MGILDLSLIGSVVVEGRGLDFWREADGRPRPLPRPRERKGVAVEDMERGGESREVIISSARRVA